MTLASRACYRPGRVWTRLLGVALIIGIAACGSDPTPPLATAEPGVVFTYPIDAQLDVPLGTRIVVTFSDPVDARALGRCAGQGASVTGAFCLVGPDGAIDAAAEVVGDGRSVQFADAGLAPGTTYAVFVRPALSPTAANLPTAGPLVTFTTRADRPRAAAPALIAINGASPAMPEAFRPMLETSTIRLVFSEPLDPRTVTSGGGSVELIETSSGTAVPVTVIAGGVHVSIDPIADLTAGARYEVRLGNQLADLSGQRLAPTTIPLVAHDSLGQVGPIHQVLRTRQAGDRGEATSRSGAVPNVIAIDKPLIGKETTALLPATLAAELGDPEALGGPIAFTIRRGQRIQASGLDIKLGGTIPVGLATGDIQIEFLTDGGGRLYRNPHQAPDQRPENERGPLYVDLSFDVAIYATDPAGNSVLSQTVLGVQASGTVTVTDGVLAIETVSSMELGLLGVTQAPANLVLALLLDAGATVAADQTPPTLVASFPAAGSSELPVDAGIELIFSEPVDLDRLGAGGLQLRNAADAVIPSVIESHGAAIVVRPVSPLAYSTSYRVTMTDVADLAGNPLADRSALAFATPRLVGTRSPMTVVAVHPGVPCALVDGDATGPGRCASGKRDDDRYHPFSLAADEPVEAVFDQPVRAASIVHGTACNAGSVRIEEVDGAGGCLAVVPGSLLRRDRSVAFVPDVPWVVGKHYRLSLISGSDRSCDAGEVCGLSGDAASFDPLTGTLGDGEAGGPDLVIDFVGAMPDGATFMFAEVSPYADINGSGELDTGEQRRDANRAALRIVHTTGAVSRASFDAVDCVPSTPEVEGCMYLLGAMPVSLGEVTSSCPVPDGTPAATCVPVALSPQAMYATSLTMDATAVITISTATGTSVMRIREPANGPVTGYIIDDGGTPTLVVELDLYMDAPDMSITLSDHDLHSKPISISLRGPVRFLPDGRIAIAVTNVADVPVAVTIDAPLGVTGSVEMILPAGEMKLQLVSRPLRGAPP